MFSLTKNFKKMHWSTFTQSLKLDEEMVRKFIFWPFFIFNENFKFQEAKAMCKKSFLSVPVSIFRNKLSPLEAVVQYLRESEYSLKEISVFLNRSNKTIWTTYNNAVKKKVDIENDYEVFIPLFI